MGDGFGGAGVGVVWLRGLRWWWQRLYEYEQQWLEDAQVRIEYDFGDRAHHGESWMVHRNAILECYARNREWSVPRLILGCRSKRMGPGSRTHDDQRRLSRPWWSLGIIGVTLLAVVGCGPSSEPADTPTSGPASTSQKSEGSAAPSTGGTAQTSGSVPSPSPGGDQGGYVVPEPSGPLVENSVEQMDWLVSCVEANGQVVEVISVDPPALRHVSSGVEAVLEECNAVAAENEWFIPSPFDGSEEGNRLLYEYWIEIYDCLVDHGYPTIPPPSEDTFVDQGIDSWNPYAGMAGTPLVVSDQATATASQRRQLEAQEICGVSAESLYAARLAEGEN